MPDEEETHIREVYLDRSWQILIRSTMLCSRPRGARKKLWIDNGAVSAISKIDFSAQRDFEIESSVTIEELEPDTC